MELDKPVESAAAQNKSRALFEKLSADFPEDPEYRSGIAGCWINLGNIYYGTDRPVEAVKAYEQAADIKDKLAAEFPAVPDYRRDLAGVYQNIGLQRSALGQDEEARAAFDRSLSLREQLVKEHPKSSDYAKELGVSLLRRGSQEADAGRFDAALGPLTQAVAVLEPIAAPDRRIAGAAFLLCNSHGARADVLQRLARHAEAVKDYDRAIVLDGGNRHPYFRIQRAVSLAHLKEHVRAAAEVDVVAGEPNLPAYLLQDAAAVHAVCSAATLDDAKLSEQYAARAVALLRRAFEKNYKAIAKVVKDDKRLDVVRLRTDFEKLVNEWEAKQKK